MTAALPPALARLGRVLGLSTGFSLHVITGPRDHVDSVYLRLARALGEGYELVRHRVHADGVQMFDALTGGDGARPRVVFVSGFEKLADEPRREAAARLNVGRDTWATHTAQVIVWLPAWGLREFRDTAPDLAHWSRSLTILHDADLPARDEAEYLLWVCERYTANPWMPLQSALGSRLAGAGARVMHWLPDAVSRGSTVREATFHLAVTRLSRTAGSEALDVWRPSFGAAPTSAAPVLLSALDVAGRERAAVTWEAVARIAGVPGGEAVGGLFAGLAARGELVVVLEVIRGADAADDPIAWLDGLQSQYPRVKILAIGARESEPVDTPPSAEWDPRQTLLGLLMIDLFPRAEGLRAFAGYMFDDLEISAELANRQEVDELVIQFVKSCESRGLVDAHFFAELRRIRPQEAERISDVEALYTGTG